MMMYLLEETGRQTRIFETLKAADKAMEERVSHRLLCHVLVTHFISCTFEAYINEKEIKISIIVKEVEG